MASHLLLFAKKSVVDKSADPEHLINLLNKALPTSFFEWAYFEDLLFHISNQIFEVVNVRSGRCLREYASVYFRFWGYMEVQGQALAAARYCDLNRIPYVDKEVLRVGSVNKITQYTNLHVVNIPFPRTLIGPQKELENHYSNYGFSFPVVLKSITGTRGSDNFLVKSEQEMHDVFRANPQVTFTMQEFIPNDGDYRVVVMGKTIPLVIERKASSGSHLNNTSQGGEAQLVDKRDLPEEVRKNCVLAAELFGRDIAGVDIVRSKKDGAYYCLEVNRAPQIEHSSYENQKAKALALYLAAL